MVIHDDLPNQVTSVLKVNRAVSRQQDIHRKARVLLKELGSSPSLVEKLCEQWASKFANSEVKSLKVWLETAQLEDPILVALNRTYADRWKTPEVSEALSIIEGNVLGIHIAYAIRNESLTWDIVDSILGRISETSGHEIVDTLRRVIQEQPNLTSQLVDFLFSCPTNPSFWSLGYVESNMSDPESEEWRHILEAGILDYGQQFVPTKRMHVPLLLLLTELDRPIFWELLGNLPFPQVVEQLFDTFCQTSDDILMVLRDVPASSPPEIHAGLPVIIRTALERVPRLRSKLEMARRASPREPVVQRIDAALEALEEWRQEWFEKFTDAIQSRTDAPYIIPKIVAVVINELLSLDIRERYDQESIQDKIVILEKLLPCLESIPDDLGSPSLASQLDGRFAALLAGVFASLLSDDIEIGDLNDKNWHRLIALLSGRVAGLHYVTLCPRPIDAWIIRAMARVLIGCSDPEDSWNKAWQKCSRFRAEMRRNTELLHENVAPSLLLLYVGWVALLHWIELHGPERFEDVEALWERVTGASIELLALTPFANAVKADRGFKIGAIIAANLSKSMRQDLLEPFDQYAHPDRELSDWLQSNNSRAT